MIGDFPGSPCPIRELPRLSGLSSDRIRARELRYGLLKPSREPSGYRTYVAEDLRLLLAVRRRLEALRAAEEDDRGPVAIFFCPGSEGEAMKRESRDACRQVRPPVDRAIGPRSRSDGTVT